MKKRKKQKSTSTEAGFCHCSFGDYEGKKRFVVKHPQYGQIDVAAPDEASAISAAADYWGDKWTRYGFYAYCDVY